MTQTGCLVLIGLALLIITFLMVKLVSASGQIAKLKMALNETTQIKPPKKPGRSVSVEYIHSSGNKRTTISNVFTVSHNNSSGNLALSDPDDKLIAVFAAHTWVFLEVLNNANEAAQNYSGQPDPEIQHEEAK